MTGPTLQCRACRNKRYCAGMAAQCRATLAAWSRGLDEPDCALFEPRWFRGLDGVADTDCVKRGSA